MYIHMCVCACVSAYILYVSICFSLLWVLKILQVAESINIHQTSAVFEHTLAAHGASSPTSPTGPRGFKSPYPTKMSCVQGAAVSKI